MKLSEYRDTYYVLSAKASDVARQLAFAGMAIIWIFKLDSKPIPVIPKQLIIPTCFFVCALASDLLHYIVATSIWGSFRWWQEKNKKIADPNLKASKYLNWPILFLFAIKLGLVAIGYVYVIMYIIGCWL